MYGLFQVPMELSQGCVHIVTAYEAVLTPTHLALVMEEAQGGSLTSHVATRYSSAGKGEPIMTEDEARYLFQVSCVASKWLPKLRKRSSVKLSSMK